MCDNENDSKFFWNRWKVERSSLKKDSRNCTLNFDKTSNSNNGCYCGYGGREWGGRGASRKKYATETTRHKPRSFWNTLWRPYEIRSCVSEILLETTDANLSEVRWCSGMLCRDLLKYASWFRLANFSRYFPTNHFQYLLRNWSYSLQKRVPMRSFWAEYTNSNFTWFLSIKQQ